MNNKSKDLSSTNGVEKIYADVVSVILGRGAMSKSEIMGMDD